MKLLRVGTPGHDRPAVLAAPPRHADDPPVVDALTQEFSRAGAPDAADSAIWDDVALGSRCSANCTCH